LRSRLFVAGRAVDLTGEKQTADRFRLERALEGARAGATAVAASGLLLVSALAFIAMRYRVDGRPTPWFAAVFVGMLVFTCLTAVVGFLAGGAGGALGQRRNTAT